MTLATKFKSVTHSSPCPVCCRNHKCSLANDGLILCGRRSGPQPGFVHLGHTKDEIWGLYRLEGDAVLMERERLRTSLPKPPPRPSVDWPARAKQLAANLTPPLADELCEQLTLPRLALDALPMIGYDPASAA